MKTLRDIRVSKIKTDDAWETLYLKLQNFFKQNIPSEERISIDPIDQEFYKKYLEEYISLGFSLDFKNSFSLVSRLDTDPHGNVYLEITMEVKSKSEIISSLSSEIIYLRGDVIREFLEGDKYKNLMDLSKNKSIFPIFRKIE